MNVRRFGAVMLLVAATVCSGALAQLDVPLPPRPVLPDDVAAHVADLEKQISDLRDGFLRGETDSLDDAIAGAEQVLAIRLEHQGPDSQAGSRWTDAQGNPAEWYEVADARWATADLRRLAALPAQDRADLASLIGAEEQAGQLMQAGRYAEAQAIAEHQLDVHRRILGAEHPNTLQSINNMGYLLHAQGRLAEAEPYFMDALAVRRRVLGDEHLDTLESVNNMGSLLQAQGRLAEAEPYLRDALVGSRRVLGDEHPWTLLSINNMGGLLQAQGRLAEAEPYWRDSLAGCRRVLGDEHPDTLGSINNIGGLLALVAEFGH